MSSRFTDKRDIIVAQSGLVGAETTPYRYRVRYIKKEYSLKKNIVQEYSLKKRNNESNLI